LLTNDYRRRMQLDCEELDRLYQFSEMQRENDQIREAGGNPEAMDRTINFGFFFGLALLLGVTYGSYEVLVWAVKEISQAF
jgi:hypothetical protein